MDWDPRNDTEDDLIECTVDMGDGLPEVFRLRRGEAASGMLDLALAHFITTMESELTVEQFLAGDIPQV